MPVIARGVSPDFGEVSAMAQSGGNAGFWITFMAYTEVPGIRQSIAQALPQFQSWFPSYAHLPHALPLIPRHGVWTRLRSQFRFSDSGQGKAVIAPQRTG